LVKPYDAIPRVPGALPVLGHSPAMLRSPLRFWSSLSRYGKVVRIRVGTQELVVVCDPELTRQVLLDDRTFDKGGPLFGRLREEMVGDGLGTVGRDEHRRQRRKVQPTFSSGRLVGYAETMAAEAAAMAKSWQDGEVIDVPEQMLKLTSTVLLSTIFAHSMPEAVRVQVTDDVTAILAGMHRRILLPVLNNLPTKSNRALAVAGPRLRGVLADIVRQRRADDDPPDDLLQILLTAPDVAEDANGARDDEEIIDELLSFFLAGVETTASCLDWALFLLATHPDVDRKVHEEAVGALAGQPSAHDRVADLPLTRRVVDESLRMYPPVPAGDRMTTKDTELGGYTVPAGTAVFHSPYVLHTAGSYPDADRFDPDRWTRPDAPSREVYLPFGAGARKCIGDRYALTEAVLTLAAVADRWRLTPASGQPSHPPVWFAMRPRALRLRVHAR
jgi:pentalenene oxygenase